MEKCKRCDEEILANGIPDGDDQYHCDCFYITLGESHSESKIEEKPLPRPTLMTIFKSIINKVKLMAHK